MNSVVFQSPNPLSTSPPHHHLTTSPNPDRSDLCLSFHLLHSATSLPPLLSHRAHLTDPQRRLLRPHCRAFRHIRRTCSRRRPSAASSASASHTTAVDAHSAAVPYADPSLQRRHPLAFALRFLLHPTHVAASALYASGGLHASGAPRDTAAQHTPAGAGAGAATAAAALRAFARLPGAGRRSRQTIIAIRRRALASPGLDSLDCSCTSCTAAGP